MLVGGEFEAEEDALIQTKELQRWPVRGGLGDRQEHSEGGSRIGQAREVEAPPSLSLPARQEGQSLWYILKITFASCWSLTLSALHTHVIWLFVLPQQHATLVFAQ